MGTITKEKIKQAIGLGTLRPKILNDFFYNIKLKSYDYDYLIQEQLVDLSVFHQNFYDVVHHNDLIMNGVRTGHKDRCAICQIDKDIVHYAKRKVYKHTNFYNTPMTQEEMMLHRDIFKFGVVVFINGVITTKFKVQAREDNTYILFPWADHIKTVQPTDIIDIAFIPECFICTSRKLTGQDKASTRALHDWVFTDIKREYFKECKGFIAYLNPVSGGDSVVKTGVTYDAATSCLLFTDPLPDFNQVEFTLTVIGMETLDQVIDVERDEKYLRIERKKMPIPKNNLLIMIANDNGYGYHLNKEEVTITEYYPNIYEISNPNRRRLKVVVLYVENPQNYLIEYDEEISYFLSKVNLLERYKQNNVPDGLREYHPVEWDYLISDYEQKAGVVTPTGDSWIPLLYKINKINDIYKFWCLFLQTYLKETYGYLDGWTLDTTTIDLNSRLRNDTAPEIPADLEEYRVFNRPQYLFTYRNDSIIETNIPFAWFIDGRFAVPTYAVSLFGYEFVYFDTDLFNPEGSWMEIERYDGSVWSKKIHIGGGKTEVTLDWLQAPILANSLIVTDEQGNYIPYGVGYDFTVIDDVGLDVNEFNLDLKNSIFLLQKNYKITITPKSAAYANKDMFLHCNNRSVVYNRDVRHESPFADINLNDLKLINRTKQSIVDRLRIYNPEGRLYPKNFYLESPTTNIAEPPVFSIMVDTSIGAPFRIEYMGYEEKRVYHQDDIVPKGIINLEGKINKPFSLVYHDVFLNGYKLNKNQIEIIAPFTIAIKNVRTTHFLDIYERVKGDELFIFNEMEDSSYIADRLIKEDPAYWAKVLEELPEIDIDPSINPIDQDVNLWIGFIREFLAKNFVDGDREYTQEELGEYDDLFTDGWRLLLNADERIEQMIARNRWFYMSHDLTLATS